MVREQDSTSELGDWEAGVVRVKKDNNQNGYHDDRFPDPVELWVGKYRPISDPALELTQTTHLQSNHRSAFDLKERAQVK